MRPSYVPSPPALFIGRQAEIERVEEMLARVEVAIIYGVGGVGKSALAYAVAARWKGKIVHHGVAPDQPVAAQVDDIRRQLAGGPVPEITRERDRIMHLAAKLDEQGALLLLDDIHRLETSSQSLLVDTLSRMLQRGRLIATSRELVSVPGAHADRFEMRLEGLDLASARALWFSLDELYGPSSGFENAWARSRGNPFLLRRVHAGGLDEDPIVSSVAALTEAERLVAGILAVADMRLPTSLILSLLPDARALTALRQLVTRMIVTLDEPGTCALHDLFRGAVSAALTTEERRTLHQQLADRLIEATLDPVVRVREVTRHLRAMERYAEAGDYLLKHSRELVRHGAMSELLRALEAIPLQQRSLDVRVCHARAVGRLLDLPRAYLELKQLSETTPEPKVNLKLALGHIAMLTANLPVAEEVLREVVQEPQLSPRQRSRGTIIFTLALTLQGRGEEARALLETADEQSADPVDRGLFLMFAAFSFWLDGQLLEAEQRVHQAQSFFEHQEQQSLRAASYSPLFLTVLWANLGKFGQAAEALQRSEALLKRSEDLRLRAVFSLCRAIYLFESGERLTALEELRRREETFERAGETLNLLWVRCWIARILLILGRRTEGLRELESAEAEIRRCGVTPFLRMLEETRESDPMLQLKHQTAQPATAKKGEVIRARALAALRAACRGESAAVDSLLDTNAPDTSASDYALDRAIGSLARAVLARLNGLEGEAGRMLEAACEDAKAGGADADLIASLLRSTGSLRVVTVEGRYVTSDRPKQRESDVLVDGQTHMIHLRRKRISLARRPILRRLFYQLAARPGAVVSKEELAQAIWNAAYHPLRHDNPLKVNVRELRGLLAKSDLSIHFDGSGYKLSVPSRFVYIDQFAAAAN